MKTKRSLFYAVLFGVITLLTFSCKKEEKAEVSLTLDKATATLSVGETAALTATVVNSTDAVVWTSSNAAVATVAGNGNNATVTAVAAGAADIKATVAGKEAVCKVTVISKEFQLQPATITVNVGANGEVAAFNAEGNIDWATEPADVSAIATVAFAGTKATITGVSEGTFKIKATNGNAVAYSDVTIKAESVDHPTVAPTADMITIAFKAPELSCGYNDIVINMFGNFQGNNPDDPDAPVAVSLNDPNYPGWFKVVFPSNGGGATAQGKLCPRQSSGAGTWIYQNKEFEILEGPGERVSDMGSDAILCNEGSVSGVIYVNVTEWSGDPCSETNPAGTASITCQFDIPEGVNTDDITLTVEGMGDGQTWGKVADLTYDEDFNSWSAVAEVPAAFVFKFVISYKGGKNVYQSGDNNVMPVNLTVNVTDVEWDSDPFVEPTVIPGGTGTFTITLGDACGAASAAKVCITGNFAEESWGDSQRQMTAGANGAWSWTGEYPDNFEYKVIFRDSEGAVTSWIGPDANWVFDGETFEQEWSCE